MCHRNFDAEQDECPLRNPQRIAVPFDYDIYGDVGRNFEKLGSRIKSKVKWVSKRVVAGVDMKILVQIRAYFLRSLRPP